MSVQDELTTVQRCVDDLVRSLRRLEQQLGGSGGLEMRRVRADADHLRESVALLRESVPEPERPHRAPLLMIPDTPYDTTLWTDSDDEGLR